MIRRSDIRYQKEPSPLTPLPKGEGNDEEPFSLGRRVGMRGIFLISEI
jgi:hypothetical protein